MQLSNDTFKKYEKMVYKKAHSVARSFSLDFEDLVGYGMERFCKAVQTYDENKGAFSTHLFYYLQALTEYAQGIVKEQRMNIYVDFHYSYRLEESKFGILVDTLPFEENEDIKRMELLDAISSELSPNSQRFLKDLFMGVFTEPVSPKGGRVNEFPVTKLPKYYGWTPSEVKRVRNEITTWWENY